MPRRDWRRKFNQSRAPYSQLKFQFFATPSCLLNPQRARVCEGRNGASTPDSYLTTGGGVNLSTSFFFVVCVLGNFFFNIFFCFLDTSHF